MSFSCIYISDGTAMSSLMTSVGALINEWPFKVYVDPYGEMAAFSPQNVLLVQTKLCSGKF